MNLPNILTLIRLVLVPTLAIVWFSSLPERGLICALVFSLAALTDWLDGFVARYLAQQTEFGAFLDPVADKLLVSTSLILLAAFFDSVLFTLSSIVIIGREILVSSIRQWMSMGRDSKLIPVSFLGKIKTFIQMVAIIICFAVPHPDLMNHPGIWLLVVATIFTVISLIDYVRKFLSVFLVQLNSKNN